MLATLLFAVGCGLDQPASPLAEARLASNKGDLDRAFELAILVPKGDAQWAEAQLMLGQIESSRRGFEVGLPYFESIPRDGSLVALQAAQGIAELQFQNGSPFVAAENFAYLLGQRRDEFLVHSRMAYILSRCGQLAQAGPHLFEVLKNGRIPISDLVMLSEPDRRPDPSNYLRSRSAMHPDDPYINLGLAVEEFANHKFVEARRRLERVVQSHPEIAAAQALLGELHVDGELSDLEAWHAQLPPAVQNDPGIWYVRGLWARRIDQPRVAARSFWETVSQLPTHRRAMYQLGQALGPVDGPASAAFTTRASQLQEYAELLESVLIQHGHDPDRFRRMIALLLEMGRDWEAWGWASLARDLLGTQGWQEELWNSLSYVPKKNPPRFREDRDVARQHNLAHYPSFEALATAHPSGGTLQTEMTALGRSAFIDQAAQLGVEFTFFQSPDARSHGVRIFESTGGGVGVIDFDQDGWPDLYFTQGEVWPVGAEHPVPSESYRDRLYRNVGAGFQESTDAAGLATEDGYGQGCSSGDFNNDGFPDLYVANIGVNRLLMNNGDGTFSDVTEQAGLTGSAWTTSCLIADLNSDGNPDLYDVNYLQGEAIFNVECGANRCSVRGYHGAPDQVQLSRGDGTFVTIPDGTPAGLGKGLGIVALFLHGETRPSLFIANDQVPNFLLRPTANDGQYSDEAMSRGLAVNRDGQTTASMGVAAGDLDHDGRTDLFVSNFEGEAKLLFLQRSEGFFEDAIVGSGLMEPGWPYVGWGSQFLDADNDGELDLVTTNGHVADFGQPGVEYRMPTQFFRNLGRGQFQLQPASAAGELFDRKLFGRGLATCDWNRDGRTDFVLSNIESPAVVATNQTATPGHWLNVRLHARDSARDAIGAIVELRFGAIHHRQQLLAGDGYQASNERLLHFGLGGQPSIDELSIQWPSGAQETCHQVPIDATVIAVEGARLVSLEKKTTGDNQPR